MAWRSSGVTNDEMIDNLKRFGVISSETVENGFRAVDRRYFVPKGNEDLAHSDQPLKEGNVHISAPHIYGAALEALELEINSSLTFLNIGSGTGYLSAIVSEILGPKSLNFGIEIHPEVIEHCLSSFKAWCSSKNNTADAISQPKIIRGNGLCISSAVGESAVGFDRIYIGAAIERSSLAQISKLLSPGGILVGPVDDQLIKINRTGEGSKNAVEGDNDGDEKEEDDDDDGDEGEQMGEEFTRQVLSGVRFASLLRYPALNTVIPAQTWSLESHKYFPEPFQKASRELMMCSNSEYVQPLLPQPKPVDRINIAAMLPKSLWIEILSFTHRRWFVRDQNEVEYLKNKLQEEQVKAAKAHQDKLDLEVRCQMAERERDVYRLLARRWQSRLQAVLEEQRNRSSSAEQSSSTSASAALQSELEGEGNHGIEEDEDAAMMEEDEEEDSSSLGHAASYDRSMEEVEDEDDEANGEEEEAYFSCKEQAPSLSIGQDHSGLESSSSTDDHSVEMSDVEDGLESVEAADMTTGGGVNIESQKVRAVSIASEDL